MGVSWRSDCGNVQRVASTLFGGNSPETNTPAVLDSLSTEEQAFSIFTRYEDWIFLLFLFLPLASNYGVTFWFSFFLNRFLDSVEFFSRWRIHFLIYILALHVIQWSNFIFLLWSIFFFQDEDWHFGGTFLCLDWITPTSLYLGLRLVQLWHHLSLVYNKARVVLDHSGFNLNEYYGCSSNQNFCSHNHDLKCMPFLNWFSCSYFSLWRKCKQNFI